ncbi:hypothetical protein NAEGRDRAFT_79005 [Naegleria gruberi]|uniref:Uncharacterized protein n=1 Tax=Naegleria gruberi TaxID=5762 RepID=D2V8J3_NAEGR|nr:uncharacterized protein NAEGRDRAFT_79005 [Naegleria gruberi]EFC46695.1 hypothetical protein NAEGRDRAFT_79005 [Naegleria gruberi]|eukprot:XP_002679439.1 hypothetical protein NAEGRDRAFT_79005 [Naegleria gruberi strain NEG-M]
MVKKRISNKNEEKDDLLDANSGEDAITSESSTIASAVSSTMQQQQVDNNNMHHRKLALEEDESCNTNSHHHANDYSKQVVEDSEQEGTLNAQGVNDETDHAQVAISNNQIQNEVTSNEVNIPDGMTRKQRIINHLKMGKNELIQVLKLCWPAVVMNVCFQLLGLESLSFIGHITLEDNEIPGITKDKVGELYMAAASLGNSFFFCLGFVIVGLIHGQDTLVSQAVGAKNFIRAGHVLARSLLTILLCSIPICVALCFANYSLYWMNQEKVLVDLVGNYLRILTPGMIPFVVCEALSLYLIAQNILMPNVIIWIISVIINFGLNWLLVFGFGFDSLGFVGAPVALTITRYIMLVMYIVFIYFKGYMKETWKGFIDIKAVFKWDGFKEYLKLALPGSVMLAAEVWGFELSTITSSFLGPTALASHSIVLNICALTFMVPLSIATATAIKIGQYMGGREPIKAKYTSYASMVFSGLFMFCSGTTLAICREWIPQIYTQDADIIYNASIIFPLCALFQFFDGVQAIAGATIRGVGKQIVGAASTLIAYYIIGLPIGAVLAFVAGWGLVGIWSGLAIALFSVFVGMLLFIRFRINWEKEAEVAYNRATTKTSEGSSSVELEATAADESTTSNKMMTTQVELEEGRVDEENKAVVIDGQAEDSSVSPSLEEDEDYSRVNSRVNLLQSTSTVALEDEE